MNRKFLLKVLALSLVLINLLSIATPAITELIPGKHSDGIKTENREINYVSLGDSMTNGYGLSGYDTCGYLEIAKDAYPARFSAWLAGFDGEISNGQTKFEGTKGTVNLTQLATSGMRAEDLRYVLEVGTENEKEADYYTASLINGGSWYGNYVEEFQNSVAEADIISMAVGNANIGVYMTDMIKQVLNMNNSNADISFATVENALRLIDADEEIELLAMEAYYKALDYLEAYLPRETANKISGIITYVVTSFLVNYNLALNRIAELNPDVEIIIVGLFNPLSKCELDIVYEGTEYTVSFEKILRILFEPINAYLMSIASLKKETQEYKDITFYYSELYDIQTLSSTFNSEYGKEDAVWYLSRFVPDITKIFFPMLSDKLELVDITYDDVYRYYFDREAYIEDLGYLGEESKNTKLYSIEIYKVLEKAICDSIPITPYLNLDEFGIKLNSDIDIDSIASEYVQSFFDKVKEDMAPNELLTLINSERTIVSLLSLYGRILLANSMSSHPCVEDHEKIFEALSESYLKGKSAEAALKDKFKELFYEGIVTEYYKNDTSRYLAIGNKGTVDMSEHYSSLLAADLELEHEFIDKADLRISDLLSIFDENYENDEYGDELMSKYDIESMRKAYTEAIERSDLITVSFGVDDFRGFITDQMMGYIVETYMDKFVTIKTFSDRFGLGLPDMTNNKTYEMDWTRFEKVISEEDVEKILDKVREKVIEQGIPEEYELIIPISSILGVESPMLSNLKLVFDLYPVDITVYLAECYLYAAMNYVYHFPSVINHIRDINPDAEIIVLGGINAFRTVEISSGENVIDLSILGEAAVLALDAQILSYAFVTEGVSYTYIKSAETELLAQKETLGLSDILSFDIMNAEFAFAPAAFNASAEGNKYIYEQIREYIVICCHHEYDNGCDAVCNKCEETREIEGHIYDNDCDAYCNVCEAQRSVEDHVYDNACDDECNVCKAKRIAGDHKFDNACDLTCNVCGATREIIAHEYDNGCDAVCNICGKERTPSPHKYDGECDEECNVCFEERVVIHIYANDCDADCDKCGATRIPEDHFYGKWVTVREATVDEDGLRERTCEICNHKESKVISKLTAVTTEKVPERSDDGIPTVVIVLIAVSVFVAAGTAVVFVVKKKMSV